MAVFKTLNSQDVIISPLKVSKNFRFEGASALTASDVGIDRFLGINGNFLTTQSLTGQVSQEYQVTVYNSAKQLYYTNYLSGSFGEVSNAVVPSFNPDGTITPPSGSSQTYNTLYYNFDETTLNPQKIFPTESIGIISIPTKLYGDYITPGSFKIVSPVSGTLYDDREGRIKLGDNYVGNIVYEHGIVIITDGNIITPTTTTTTTSTTTTTAAPTTTTTTSTTTTTAAPTTTTTTSTTTASPNCYTIETVQSAQGECFDCSGYFASSTDTIIKFFSACSGSIIPAPFDINVTAHYSDNSTGSIFIPSGATGSILIAFSDVQCAPLPACGEIASPTFDYADVIPVVGSISECCAAPTTTTTTNGPL
jgi:hypothetical protein